MTDSEAFEAWTKERKFELDADPLDPCTVWHAALAYERAKQNAATNVGIDWANPATLNGVLCHAVQAEPSKDQYEQECSDIDAVLTHLGLDIEQCRTDGGWLNVPKIKTLLQQAEPAATVIKTAVTNEWLFNECFAKYPTGIYQLYAAPPAVQGKTQGYTISRDEEWNLVVTEGTYEDDEAVRLLREARRTIVEQSGISDLMRDKDAELLNEIDAYLARVKK